MGILEIMKNRHSVRRYKEHPIEASKREIINTCWVAMTHGKSKAKMKRGQKLLIIISLGYGETQGNSHKSKNAACTFLNGDDLIKAKVVY